MKKEEPATTPHPNTKPKPGWRSFVCVCGGAFELPARDHESKGAEVCPNCGEEVRPIGSRQDASLVVDGLGRLSLPGPTQHEYEEVFAGVPPQSLTDEEMEELYQEQLHRERIAEIEAERAAEEEARRHDW